MNVETRDTLTGEISTKRVDRGQYVIFQLCRDDNNNGKPECRMEEPNGLKFYETEERFTLVDWIGGGDSFPGPQPVEIGRLLLQIEPGAAAGETRLMPVRVPYLNEHQIPASGETGGYVRDRDRRLRFAPALETTGGRITILDRGPVFIRGDADGNGEVNLTNAVRTLNYLFRSGGDPGCLAAADADDNAEVAITDAIVVLGSLFLGRGPLPAPYPACGSEVGPVDLACGKSPCS